MSFMSDVIFENAYLTIRYFKDRDFLSLKWRGFAGRHFRSLATEIIKAIEKTRTTRLLSDNTDWKIISPNDHGWAAGTWFPIAEEKGVKLLATVLSADYFNRAAERSIEEMADVNCMNIKNFDSLEKALSWLMKTKPLPKC